MSLNRIINFIPQYRRPSLNYDNVEGELGDIELNISTETSNSVLDNVNDDFQPQSDKLCQRIWKKYLFFKEASYNEFYRQLNEATLGELNSPITFLVDEFVLKFLFAMGFIGQSPVSWLIAGMLFLIGKKRDRRISFWGYLNISFFLSCFFYFIYVLNQPVNFYNPAPRIPLNYKLETSN